MDISRRAMDNFYFVRAMEISRRAMDISRRAKVASCMCVLKDCTLSQRI